MRAFSAGTLAGAGSFQCERCGYAVALHGHDEMPDCPRCTGGRFRRASMFTAGSQATADVARLQDLDRPDWLPEAREALVKPGDYIAFDDGERVSVVPLQEGWTRLGRSLAAHVRFDDPTVSRRHALVHREGETVRVLDDRSLNGVWVNGERVDWRELSDGDEVAIGRFRLYLLRIAHERGIRASAA